MKKLILLLFIPFVSFGQSFCSGWELGYKKGLQSCMKLGNAPICPMPKINENSYGDGYGLGYAKAKEKCNDSNNLKGYTVPSQPISTSNSESYNNIMNGFDKVISAYSSRNSAKSDNLLPRTISKNYYQLKKDVISIDNSVFDTKISNYIDDQIERLYGFDSAKRMGQISSRELDYYKSESFNKIENIIEFNNLIAGAYYCLRKNDFYFDLPRYNLENSSYGWYLDVLKVFISNIGKNKIIPTLNSNGDYSITAANYKTIGMNNSGLTLDTSIILELKNHMDYHTNKSYNDNCYFANSTFFFSEKDVSNYLYEINYLYTNNHLKINKNPNEIDAIFPGCDKGNNESKRKCMSEKITKFVERNFNWDIGGLGLTGSQRISVIYKIDKDGNVTDVMAKAPHPRLENEAQRVINLLPRFLPGTQRGKAVIVPYSIPIIFNVVE